MSRDIDTAKAALAAVLAGPKWKEMGGVDESTIYGELAIDVALAVISAEREACARIVDQFSAEVVGQPKLMGFVDMIAREIRARKSD